MRGRLIVPFLVQLYQLDTVATAADPDAGGPETSGYDPDFREPIVLPDGTSARKEKSPILVPVQIEPLTYEKLAIQPSGNDPQTTFGFVFHFADLEDLGMIDSNGNATIRLGDRAAALYRYEDNTLIMKLGLDGKGIYCTEAQPRSFGLSGGERNLLLATFDCRERAYHGGT